MARSILSGARRWGGLIAFLLPVIVWLAFRLPVMTAIGFTDAFYYFAYADNFHESVERYGFLYYPVRLGTIFPELLFRNAWVYGVVSEVESVQCVPF